jgi:butyrate kinase
MAAKSTKKFTILVINPGSTSTKIALFEDGASLWEKTINHSSSELEQYKRVWDQYDFRKQTILKELKRKNVPFDDLSAVVGRGGLLPPIESGTYRVNNAMIDDLRAAERGDHASNLGPVLAYGIAWDLNIEAFTVDPVSVDELEPLARYTGHPEFPKVSFLHALNIRAVARKFAALRKKPLDSLNIIVTHMGGGVTSCAMRQGRMVDVNNGVYEGPFTPERAGFLPTYPLIDLCFSGKYTKAEIKQKCVGKGGLVAYLGTNSAKTVEEMINGGNQKARETYEAMAYQIAQEIGKRATSLKGRLDGIVLTGGLAHSKMLTDWITERVEFICPVTLIPGEDEMEALALGALRALKGEEPVKRYGEQKRSVGVIVWETLSEYEISMDEFEKALHDAGYKFRTSDENLEIIYRNCNEQDVTCRNIIKDFLDLKVDLIYSIGTPIISTVKKMLLGKDVPVVFAAAFDPVVMGLTTDAEGSARNITGTYYRVSLADQIDRGFMPLVGKLSRLGMIHNSDEFHSQIQIDEAKKLAAERKFELCIYEGQKEEDFVKALEYFKEKQIDALFLLADTTTSEVSRKAITDLAHTFPTLCGLRSTVMKGGLVAYCACYESLCDRSAAIAVRILAGEKPQHFPFAGPDEYRLIINLQTAARLGLKVSEEVKAAASELIT